MAVGLLYGSPMHPLTRNRYATGDALAQWISREIPSFVGEVPFRYGQALLRELDKHNVPYAIAKDAFLKLAQRGFRFEASEAVLAPLRIRKDMIAAPSSLRGVTKEEADRMTRFTLEEYERRYVLAIRTNDPQGAEVIFIAVLKLLIGWAKGKAAIKKAGGGP